MRYIKQFIVFAVLAIILSCNFSEESALKQKLTDKYGEKFIIHNHEYNWVLKTYQFQASAVRYPEFIFVGEHNEDFSAFTDQYIVNYLSFIYADKVRNELEQYSSPVFVYTSLIFNDNIYDYKKLSVDSLNLDQVFNRAESVDFQLYCYFFDELNEASKLKLLSGINNILQFFANQKNATVSLYTYYWDKTIFNYKSVKDIEKDFYTGGSPIVKSEFKKYIKQRLRVYFETNKPLKLFNEDTLYKNKVEVASETFGISGVNLNHLEDDVIQK